MKDVSKLQQTFFPIDMEQRIPRIYIYVDEQRVRDNDNDDNEGIVSKYKKNYKKGEKQEVYPIKKKEQIQAITDYYLERGKYRDLLIFTLGINIGLRAGDLLSLKIGDVCGEDGEIRYISESTDTNDKICVIEDKTDKRRTFYLNRACINALNWYFSMIGYTPERRCCLRSCYLFKSREGVNKPIEVDTIRKSLKEAAEYCGITQNIGTHTLRKTFGYWQYVVNEGNPRVVSLLQRLFNHSSELITLRYIGIMEEEDKAMYNNLNIFTIGNRSND